MTSTKQSAAFCKIYDLQLARTCSNRWL